mmetsp:Transcript_19102/g.44775  ORF Transcript_19102/g.44775 Transcript_19102/m.44775 type:complete len:279 (-) Transcript_19102:165-1001(-)
MGDRAKAALRDSAAGVIQRAWTNFTNVRIFKYYRDLISFREKGDPGVLLKCINPREAALVADHSFGGVVRFRLGGNVFPPMIYYKIFCARPVQDIGAFAPRDYTVEKAPDPKVKHIKGVEARPENRDNWYQRFENNGWRPVTKMWFTIDSVTHDQPLRKTFHHKASVRQQEREEHRRRRKLEWMQKMYKEGAARERSAGGASEVQAWEDGTHGPLSKFGGNVGGELESEDLLNWASSLDFDAYASEWTVLATSAASLTGVTPPDTAPGSSGLQQQGFI